MFSQIESQKWSCRVALIGLDFGSAPSSAMMATAAVEYSSTPGRMELGSPQIIYRSDPVFTPFDDERIDSVCLNSNSYSGGLPVIETGGVAAEKGMQILTHKAAGNRLEEALKRSSRRKMSPKRCNDEYSSERR